jgi:glucuronoarabinoxylan endo-1,4-beta-xylanase
MRFKRSVPVFLISCFLSATASAELAVDFAAGQITGGIQHEYYDFPLDLAGAPQAALPNYAGQPIYAGLFLEPVNGWVTGVDDGGAYTNGAAISFGSSGGAKLQLNGPWLGSGTSTIPGLDDGRYAPGDRFTGIFIFQQEDFINGLDTETVAMAAGFDTLSADLVYQPKGILASGAFRWVIRDNGSFYISEVVTNLTAPDNIAVTIQDNALGLSWYHYDPVGDGTLAMVSNIAAIGAAATPSLQNIEASGFWLQAVVAANTGFRTYPRLGLEGYRISVVPPGSSGSGACVIDAAVHYQTMEGFGASGAWYENRLLGHNNEAALYNLLFRDLGLDIYRLRNVYQQGSYAGKVANDAAIIADAELALGRPLRIMISSWTPPASLKSTGSESGANNATLASDGNGYRYDDFAAWWSDSLAYYSAQGIDADYISIQNEPNWHPDYDGCGFDPTETATFAGYDQAFEAVWQTLAADLGTNAMPKMIGPEPIGFNRLDEYIDALIDPDHMYGYAHHLYQSNPAQNPDVLNAQMAATKAAYGDKPLFQTEYAYLNGNTDSAIQRKLDQAKLMYNGLTIEDLAAYFYWGLFWNGEQGLIDIPDSSSYNIIPEYYAFKHYSAFVHADWQRVDVNAGTNAVSISAFTSPDRDEMSVIVVNEGTASVNLDIMFNNAAVMEGEVYRSTDVLDCAFAGAFTPGAPVLIPARSITTLSLVTKSPTVLWNEWIAGYPGVGANSGQLDHGDSDKHVNLSEYAWGGDPSVANDPLINIPLQSWMDAGGTNFMEYVYFERTDAASRGLASVLSVATDLAAADWTDGGPYEVGRGASGVAGYNAVTNRVPVDSEAAKFIKLEVRFTP